MSRKLLKGRRTGNQLVYANHIKPKEIIDEIQELDRRALKDGYSNVVIDWECDEDDGSLTFYFCGDRLETDAEVAQREKWEADVAKSYEQDKEDKLQYLRKEAEKLGYVLAAVDWSKPQPAVTGATSECEDSYHFQGKISLGHFKEKVAALGIAYCIHVFEGYYAFKREEYAREHFAAWQKGYGWIKKVEKKSV